MKSDKIWIKYTEQKRGEYIAKTGGGYEYVPLPSFQKMEAMLQRSRRWIDSYNARNLGCPAGWRITKHDDAHMIALGYQQIDRRFIGEVIILPALSGRDSVAVQLPPEYGDAVVRMYACDLAVAICEGLLRDDRIRGPFRLVEFGGTMTLRLLS